MPKKIEMIGRRFEDLIVLSESHSSNAGIYWNCICECGNKCTVRGTFLRNGETKSCGCLNKRIITKHGMHGTPTYNSWHGMIERCRNPKCENYHNYGGRGIKVCKRWFKFTNFFKDMGIKPKGLTIDRKDNQLGYFKDNCGWSSPAEQQHNRRICKHNRTGVAGVHWSKQVRKYRAYINAYGKRHYLGFFNTIREAAEARKQGELEYWGASCL